MNQNNNSVILDLYCGPGGFSTGFNPFFHVSDAVDIDKFACETYSENHKDTTVHKKQVEIYIDNLIRKDYDGIIGVIGGPPCQEFSQLNHHKKINSPRSKQIFVMIEAIKKVQPEFAVIENVSSIPKKIKEAVIKSLIREGYKIKSNIIRAYDYGSVQIRRRWILIACKSKNIFPEIIHNERTSKDILRKGASEIKMSDRIRNELKNLPSGKWVALPNQKYKSYFIIDPLKPMPAVVNPSKLRYVRPNRKEYLSFQELALAQGWKGGKGAISQQIANAIPVELSYHIAKTIYNKINN